MTDTKVSDPTAASMRASSRHEAPATRFRWLMSAVGVLCVGLGVVGAFVPGLPTTVFVLSGSFLLARSSPTLERRLRASRRLSPYLKYADPGTPMPLRARVAAIVSMWTSIGVSTIALTLGHANQFVTGGVLCAGVVGTAAIAMFRRGVSGAADAPRGASHAQPARQLRMTGPGVARAVHTP